jgi:hypothetical protein
LPFNVAKAIGMALSGARNRTNNSIGIVMFFAAFNDDFSARNTVGGEVCSSAF